MDNDMIERLNIFLVAKTYTYIQDIFNYNFNGFIVKIDETKITFKDDELGNIPIRIADIKKLSYSNKSKGGKENER